MRSVGRRDVVIDETGFRVCGVGGNTGSAQRICHVFDYNVAPTKDEKSALALSFA